MAGFQVPKAGSECLTSSNLVMDLSLVNKCAVKSRLRTPSVKLRIFNARKLVWSTGIYFVAASSHHL
jgi:hypothetical protein